MKKYIAVAAALLLVGAGCSNAKKDITPAQADQSANVQPTTSAEEKTMVRGEDAHLGLSFEYADTYTFVSSYSENAGGQLYPVWMTVKSKTNPLVRLELWDKAVLDDRPFGFSGEEDPKEVEGYLPKVADTISVGGKTYMYFIFNPKNDTAAKAELEAVLSSIKVK